MAVRWTEHLSPEKVTSSNPKSTCGSLPPGALLCPILLGITWFHVTSSFRAILDAFYFLHFNAVNPSGYETWYFQYKHAIKIWLCPWIETQINCEFSSMLSTAVWECFECNLPLKTDILMFDMVEFCFCRRIIQWNRCFAIWAVASRQMVVYRTWYHPCAHSAFGVFQLEVSMVPARGLSIRSQVCLKS